MITGYHVIFGAYGFWLPNDPRGSWSTFVGSWKLFHEAGPATKTTKPFSLAHKDHDQIARRDVKDALQLPAVKFTGVQARAVGRGIGNYVERTGLIMWACAVMPNHVHIVLAPPRLSIERLVIQLKGEATRQLMRESIHPFASFKTGEMRTPKCWSRGEWKVFLNREDVPRAIAYVRNNPLKENMRRQKWSFVSAYS